MAAASIELETETGAHLLFRTSINMDVIWSVLQVLRQDSKARTTIFPSPKDGSLSPVSPEDVLLKDSHGIGVQDPMHYYLSVLTSQSGSFDFISSWEKRCCQKEHFQEVSITIYTYNAASAQ